MQHAARPAWLVWATHMLHYILLYRASRARSHQPPTSERSHGNGETGDPNTQRYTTGSFDRSTPSPSSSALWDTRLPLQRLKFPMLLSPGIFQLAVPCISMQQGRGKGGYAWFTVVWGIADHAVLLGEIPPHKTSCRPFGLGRRTQKLTPVRLLQPRRGKRMVARRQSASRWRRLCLGKMYEFRRRQRLWRLV